MTPREKTLPSCPYCGPVCRVSFGYCHCGCGGKTKIATKTRTRLGHVKGEPQKFIHNHTAPGSKLANEWDGSVCICRRPNCTIPYGKCHCGCGKDVKIARQSHRENRYIIGRPIMYISGHSGSSRGKDRKPMLFLKLNGRPVTFVPLIRGKYTIVDRGVEKNYPGLWNMSGAYVRYFDPLTRRNLLIHRAIMGNPDGMQVDHINGDPLDNRSCNLRIVTHLENCHNRKISASNKSGVPGVRWEKKEKRWVSSITYKRSLIFLGRFKEHEFDLAVKARQKAEKKLFGKFARRP